MPRISAPMCFVSGTTSKGARPAGDRAAEVLAETESRVGRDMSDLLILFRVRDSPDEPQTGTNIHVFQALLQDKSDVRPATITAAFAANVLQLWRCARAREFRTAAGQLLSRRASARLYRGYSLLRAARIAPR